MSSHKKKSKRDKKKRARAKKRRPPFPNFLAGSTVLVEPPGQLRMSEVIMEFLEPFAGQWSNVDDLKKLVSIGTIAWNAALLPAKERADFIQEAVAAVPPEGR